MPDLLRVGDTVPRVISHPNSETTEIAIPLADARSEKALGAALGTLLLATKNLAALIKNPKGLARESKYSSFLVTTFVLPKGKTLGEREFFERCAEFPKLHKKMVAYARNVNSRSHGISGLDGDLCHDETHPAGCYAIVPLALRDKKYIDPLIEHMLGWDMDHETFHLSLIDELLKRHKICDETMRLLAYRAIDGGGQNGPQNLAVAYARRGLKRKLAPPGAIEAFATLVAKQSKRVPGAGKRGDGPRHYLEIYVVIAARALFGKDAKKVDRFIDVFRKRKVTFSASALAAGQVVEPREPPDFALEWDA